MREVFGIGSGGGGVSSRKLDRPVAAKRSEGPEVEMKMSTIPGYLELPPEKMNRLICQEPIEDFYEVEDQPFARGKYAAVRRCKDRSSGQQYAAKFLRKRRRSADLRPEILHEVAVLEACSSSTRIVRLHRVFESAHEMILLLELASGGELQMLLDRDEVPEERQVKRLMRQILDGLVYLHSINVAHLDIKPQNLVLMSEFPHGEVKLCDLGISRYISQGADIRDILGTPDYVAPEVLNYEPISLATDMWSVGVLLYVLLTGCSPFGGDTKQETFCNISQCKLDFPDDLFEDVSEDAKDLMRKLMVKEPSMRLSAVECLKHRWFTDMESVLLQPVPSPIRCSESVSAKIEEIRTKLSSPALTRKQENVTTSQSVSSHEIITTSKTLPSAATTITTSLTVHRSREVSTPTVKSSLETSPVPSVAVTSQGDTKTTEKVGKTTEKVGMSFSRKSRFMKNMEHLAQSYLDVSNTKNNNVVDNTSTTEKTDNSILNSVGKLEKTSTTVNVASNAENDNSTFVSVRSVNKATATQTMPINGIVGYKFNHLSSNTETISRRKEQNVNISTKTETEVPRRVLDNKDCVYTFRRCFIIDDSEDETNVGHSAAPILVHGPVTAVTTENGHSYSDHSSSDSGSDTVSEMSIDSSSDRSSIISLDDSLLEYNYSKINGRPYPGLSYVSYGATNHNVWDSAGALNVPRSDRASRYSYSETFSKAFARFNSIPGEKEEPSMKKTQEKSIFSTTTTTTRKQLAKAAHTSVLNKVLLSAVSSDNTTATRKVDFLRERNGNLVVIREVKSGKYSRVSEVKCESVQSRIRKLQVQGGKS